MWQTPSGFDCVLDLETSQADRVAVDFHLDLSKFNLTDDVFDRAATVKLGPTKFLVPCPEDHLRIVALHFLKDGGWQPIPLIDVAAMVEAASNDFDWELCMGKDPVVADWIATAIVLAHELLGAEIDAVPPKYRKKSIPEWLRKSIEKAWEGPFVSPYAGLPFGRVWQHPTSAWKEIRRRWPNPIIATVSLHLPFDDRLRWPIQARWFVTKAARFVGRLWR